MRSLYIYPSMGAADAACRAVVASRAREWCLAETRGLAYLAIAPLLSVRLSSEAAAAPTLGTLILHPSLLPLRRGPDTVRWAVLSGDTETGITWFWCADRLDAGAICAQVRVPIPSGITPRRLYEDLLVPAAAAALGETLDLIAAGRVRRELQDEARATTQGWHPSRKAVHA